MENFELTLLLVRAVERLMSVAIGGLSIYFGYRLFLNLPNLPTGDGSLSLAGKTALTLTRVGPGVFFSLFGATVVAVALKTTSTWEKIEQPGSSTIRYSAAAPTTPIATQPALPVRRDVVERTIGDLNAVPSLLAAHVDDAKRRHVQMAIDEAKLALIRSAWSNDWGAWEDFHRWTLSGGEPPAAAGEPARIFHKGAKP